MEKILVYLGIVVLLLDIVTIFLIVFEDIYFSIPEKIVKIILVLVIPVFGAIIILRGLFKGRGKTSSDNAQMHSQLYEVSDSSFGD